MTNSSKNTERDNTPNKRQEKLYTMQIHYGQLENTLPLGLMESVDRTSESKTVHMIFISPNMSPPVQSA